MTINNLQPNTRYGLPHGKPLAIERDNDGSFLYRFNIAPEMGIPEGEEEEQQIGWTCYEVRIFVLPTSDVLKKAVIRSLMDESAEMALINKYNKHVLGIKKDEAAVMAYKEFLQFTEDLSEIITNDLANN